MRESVRKGQVHSSRQRKALQFYSARLKAMAADGRLTIFGQPTRLLGSRVLDLDLPPFRLPIVCRARLTFFRPQAPGSTGQGENA